MDTLRFILFLSLAMGHGLVSSLVVLALIGPVAGLCFGLVFGLAAAILVRPITISLRFDDREAFLSRLHAAFVEIGYRPLSRFNTRVVYQPSLKAGLFADTVVVQIEDTSATVLGSAPEARELKSRLQGIES